MKSFSVSLVSLASLGCLTAWVGLLGSNSALLFAEPATTAPHRVMFQPDELKGDVFQQPAQQPAQPVAFKKRASQAASASLNSQASSPMRPPRLTETKALEESLTLRVPVQGVNKNEASTVLQAQALQPLPSPVANNITPPPLKAEPLPNKPTYEAPQTKSSAEGEPPLAVKLFKGRSQILKFAQSIVRVAIADPTLADIVPLSPTQIMINGKQRGTTSLVVWDEEGQEGIFELQVRNDTSEVLDAIKAIAPNEAMEVRITDDSLVVSGQISNSVILDEIRQLAAAYGFREEHFIDLTETPVPQISLEVRIAEANKSVLKDLKVGLSTSVDNNFAFSKIDSIAQAAGSTVQIGALPQFNATNVGGLLAALGTSQLFNNVPLSVRLDLLQTEGKINLLAEPNLVCTHGRTASFLAGGEFPFVVGVNQNGQPIIQYKEYGVRLRFTPWIAIRSKRIELRVEPEVSSIDTTTSQVINGTQIFGLLSRKTDTTVELADGESLFISGLLSRDETETMRKIPYAGDLPVLGALFRNKASARADRELIVVVTPHLVAPGDVGQLLGPSSMRRTP
jgi:pilus assembly protein CpaC